MEFFQIIDDARGLSSPDVCSYFCCLDTKIFLGSYITALIPFRQLCVSNQSNRLLKPNFNGNLSTSWVSCIAYFLLWHLGRFTQQMRRSRRLTTTNNIQQQMTNYDKQQTTTNKQQPTNNNKRQITSNKQQNARTRLQTTKNNKQ